MKLLEEGQLTLTAAVADVVSLVGSCGTSTFWHPILPATVNSAVVSLVVRASESVGLEEEPGMKRWMVGFSFTFGLTALLIGALTVVPAVASFPGPLTVDTASEGYSCSNGVCTFPSGTVGASYANPITSTGGSGPTPYTWSVVSGSLPAGLSLTSSYGVYSAYVYGTPTTAETSTFTLQVRDGIGETAQQAFTLTINPANPTKHHR